MVLSFLYWAFRRLLELVVLRLRSAQSKDIEILVLRHQLHVLAGEGRPRLEMADRTLLAALSRVLPRADWRSFLVRPDTLLRWHRELVRRRWTYSRGPGRPPIAAGLRELILRLTAENPTWGYRRIQGGARRARDLGGAEHGLVAILRRHGVDPAPRRASVSWREFLHAQAAGIIACDFFTVDTVWLKRFYVLFFIELESRRVHLAGITSNPHGPWVAQQARNLVMTLAEQDTPVRFLIRDRDSKFSFAFDEVFRSEGIRVIRTPPRAPKAKAHAERWVASVRRECLDRILIFSRAHLERVLRGYTIHYNRHRPHRALAQRSPIATLRPAPQERAAFIVRRRDLLGGLLHEYEVAA